MTVIINGRFLTQPITGVQRYATEVVKAWDRLIDRGDIDPDAERPFALVTPKGAKYELELEHIPIRQVGRLSGHRWEQLELPFYVQGNLLVSLGGAAPLFKHDQVVTIHDAAPYANPENFSVAFRTWYKVLHRGLGKVAKKIVTVSHFSKAELNRFAHIAENKMEVIYEGKEHISAVAADKTIMEKYKLNHKPFALAVSSVSPNKNFKAVAHAIELLGDVDFDVVIAGGANPRIFNTSRFSLPESIKHVGYVSDGELKALYENATCFVYPSFYEGFGLPPLEAMTCGCPVIASNTSSLPEVCGDAALYCDPYNPADIAVKITELMKTVSLRKTLQQRGLERVELFSWERCAQEIFGVIEQIRRS